MNDQIKERPPLQGKVILEPALTVASDERPPAPAQRLEEASFERLDELDDFTEVESALVSKPRRRHRLLAWGLGAVGLLSLGQYGAFLYDQFLTTPLWGSAWLAASALVAAALLAPYRQAAVCGEQGRSRHPRTACAHGLPAPASGTQRSRSGSF